MSSTTPTSGSTAGALERPDIAGWLPRGTRTGSLTEASQRDIARRRRALYEAASEVEARAAMASGASGWSTGLRSALENLEFAITDHIDEIEQEGGLFEEVVQVAPRLTNAIRDLEADHRDLLQACRDAGEAMSGPHGDPGPVRHRVNHLLGQVAIHRQRGAELLYDAYMVDISAGD